MSTEVLVYPNITYARNLEADSFVCDLRALLPRLGKALPGYVFTLMLPGRVASLDLPNVKQVDWPLPTYPNAMRCHFDVPRFLQIVDAKHRSWDLVWSHLPEQTLAIRNAIGNLTDERPPIVGYSHWVEIPELNTLYADTFPAWLAGALQMRSLGVTTGAMKATILSRADVYLSEIALNDLDNIVRPMYLGVEAPPAGVRIPDERDRGLLVWNHRPHSYTGWPSVVEALDELWTRRQDFRVVCSLDDSQVAGKPWGVPSGLPAPGTQHYRRAYFELLSRAWAGLPRLNSHWTWPVAIADGMAAGMPYVVPRDFYAGEVFPEDYPFLYGGSGKRAGIELVWALERMLDAPPALHQTAVYASVEAAAGTSWDARVEPFVDQLRDAAESTVPAWKSTKYADLKPIAEAGATKRQLKHAMGWGNGIPWTPYRARLRAEGVPMDASTYGHGPVAPDTREEDEPLWV